MNDELTDDDRAMIEQCAVEFARIQHRGGRSFSMVIQHFNHCFEREVVRLNKEDSDAQ